jgi:hypothetical protein
MIKLLSFWLAWRAIRMITAATLVIGAVALLANGRAGAPRRGEAALTQLRHATHPLEQQLERTLEKAFQP